MKIKLKIITLTALLLTMFGAVSINAQKRARTQEGTVAINGAQIYYTITGTGEPLVLIHGYPLDNNLFVEQREDLSNQFKVITLDLRGFGRSAAPSESASINLYATDVLSLMDYLGIQRAIIGGHSMGGATTLEMYRIAPQRFRGMILIDPAAFPPPTIEKFMWRGFQQQARESGAASIVPILLPEFLTGDTRLNDARLVAEITNQILAASVNGLVGGAMALETRPDFRPLFPTISVPTLLIYGIEDSLTPIEQGQMLDRMIPNSDLEIIRNATHGAVRERSEPASAAIRNWTSRNNLR